MDALLQTVVDTCRDLRHEAVLEARAELLKNGWQSEVGYARERIDTCETILNILGATDDRDWNDEVFGVGAAEVKEPTSNVVPFPKKPVRA